MGDLFHRSAYLAEVILVLGAMFTLLVAAHELGHYLFARLFNMGVEEFAIGFGKRPIYEWMRRTYVVPLRPGEVSEISHPQPAKFDLESGGQRPAEDVVEFETPDGKFLRETTRFTIRAWPLGGFVRIKGMMPEEDGSEVKIAGGFYSKPPWQRWLVLFAGPLFSVVAGILILVPIFMVEPNKPSKQPVFGMLLPTGAAKKAGLQEGDRIVSVDGTPITNFYQVVELVRFNQGKTVDLVVNRLGKTLDFKVTPVKDNEKSPVLTEDFEPSGIREFQWRLGAGSPLRTAGFGEAISMACSFPVDAVSGLMGIVAQPSTFKDQVGGPVSIAGVTYQTVKDGPSQIFKLAALLSISIGILNLLPVAPLDGGQMVFALVEMFKRRRLSIQFQSMVTMFGMAFMLVLIVCVCFVDVSKLIDKGKAPKEAPPAKATK